MGYRWPGQSSSIYTIKSVVAPCLLPITTSLPILRIPLERIKNLNVAVKEWQDDVVFLHKIVAGAADKSYGIHVARLAGVPSEVNRRARSILQQLESESGGTRQVVEISERPSNGRGIQLTLFDIADHPLLDEIREMNLDELAPVDALMKIKAWQQTLQSELAGSKPR